MLLIGEKFPVLSVLTCLSLVTRVGKYSDIFKLFETLH
jgi:hypothetical protein